MKPTDWVVFSSERFYWLMGTLVDLFPDGVYVNDTILSSLFIEDALDRQSNFLTPERFMSAFIVSEPSSLSYATDLLVEHYNPLNTILLRDMKKHAPFLLQVPHTLEDTVLLPGSHSFALRVHEDESKRITRPRAATDHSRLFLQ